MRAIAGLLGAAGVSACGADRRGAVVPDSSLAWDQPITGRVVDVRVFGGARGDRFEPADVRIRPGDGVRWVVVSGGPHQVRFLMDSIPPHRDAHVWANMPDSDEKLTGPAVPDSAAYTVSFGGAKPGTYVYRCIAGHASRGIAGASARVTVE